MKVAPPQPEAPPATFKRLRGLYLIGLGALSLPGVLIGVPLGFALQPRWPAQISGLLSGVALLCSLLTLGLAWRQARSPEPGSTLSAAVLLASAPAVPLLMACALWRRGDALVLLLPLALLSAAAGWALLRSWAVAPPAHGPARKSAHPAGER
ncbi:hypothetical protein DKM44_01370 [Deinococcus irradiatisoli]|uniref:Uncharacterized protein n=1 Tax=Deinococcus irradiatisoli TaxID=2202254 RepID=A0A2Z3JAM4_9DEIO|nr:hypothetical protein [Deinococcus irradiatisoli]AWN22052.1 hypothetical protein DKM44_01370 [Deinococcus irradiatisoli]